MAPIRVLLVDDAVVVRRMLTDLLTAEPDIEVAGTAPNGRVALAKLDQLAPDLVVLDVEMPEMDGLQTLRELRQRRPRLPVIMFSTLTERGAATTLEALSLGASDYLTKPTNSGSVLLAAQSVREQLLPKIRGLTGRVAPAAAAPRAPSAAAAPAPKPG
ncbi:MAG: response regulator, partial [Gemmatimonadales bacterium]|nr:response regulator [Gemmatimonadales bacterium]